MILKFILFMLWAHLYLAPQPIVEKPVTEEPIVEEPKEEYTDTYVVTAYTAGYESTGKNPGDKGYGLTASGKYVEEGVTLSCPPELPFGTVVKIENVGERICYDRGGHIVGKRLDLYIEDLDRALEFGRQSLRIQIIEK